MSFFKIVILTILSFILYNSAIADSHDKKQDIIEKAKEINQQIKKKQHLMLIIKLPKLLYILLINQKIGKYIKKGLNQQNIS